MTDATIIREPATPASPAQTMALAAELASYARAANDPLAMMEAARALRGVQRDLFKPGMATPAMLFGEARILAEGDAETLAEIEWVQNDTPRTVRVVGGRYAVESWAVRRTGDASGLKPAVQTLPPLRNTGSVWSVSFPRKAG